MFTAKGIPASAGIVSGVAVFSKAARIVVKPERAEDTQAELCRFADGQNEALRELDALCQEVWSEKKWRKFLRFIK